MIHLSLVQYVPHKFLTGICVVSSIRKIVYFLKQLWLRYSSYVRYIAKVIVIILTNINIKNHSRINHNHTQGTTRNIPWAFFQEHTHPLKETSSRGSYNSQEFDRDNLFYFLGVFSHREPSKARLKHPL